jgi:hypothetical protein
MVAFGDPNDRFHHIWEAAATAAALVHGVIDLRRNDQAPWILIEQLDDRLFDLPFGDEIAMANQHFRTRVAGGAATAPLI